MEFPAESWFEILSSTPDSVKIPGDRRQIFF